ncbi:hypothetical protein [Pedobacter steynii]
MSGSSSDLSFVKSPATRDCGDLQIKIHLASPDPDVIKDLGINDVLRLTLKTSTGPVVASYDGKVAGAILTTDPGFLISCISQGYGYSARVVSLTGGDCQVAIYCSERP